LGRAAKTLEHGRTLLADALGIDDVDGGSADAKRCGCR
jgi:hypothetical protein